MTYLKVQTQMKNVFSLQMQDANEQEVSFEEFWLLWPKRQAKKDAIRAWNKLTSEQQSLAIIALYDWRLVWLSRNEMQYVPLPASWLNGERWDDELPPEYRPRYQAPVPRQAEDKTAYVPMPEHVRALIAKLRGK